MPRFLFACLTVFAVLAATLAAGAAGADEPVEMSGVNGADLRVLQAALILTEDYDGALDGSWGPQSRTALAGYTRRVHGDATPRPRRIGWRCRSTAGRGRARRWRRWGFRSTGPLAKRPC